MSEESPPPERVDRVKTIQARFRNHPIGASLVLIAALLSGVAATSESVSKIYKTVFSQKASSPQINAAAPVSLNTFVDSTKLNAPSHEPGTEADLPHTLYGSERAESGQPAGGATKQQPNSGKEPPTSSVVHESPASTSAAEIHRWGTRVIMIETNIRFADPQFNTPVYLQSLAPITLVRPNSSSLTVHDTGTGSTGATTVVVVQSRPRPDSRRVDPPVFWPPHGLHIRG
jgi:hypothetical protein